VLDRPLAVHLGNDERDPVDEPVRRRKREDLLRATEGALADLQARVEQGSLSGEAAIGLAVGAGYYSGAIITTILVLIALWPLRIIGYRVMRQISPAEDRLLVELPAGASPAPVIEALDELGARVEAIEVTTDADRRALAIDVAMPARRNPADVVARVADVEGALEVHWME
jgi:uncharacterized membrane protein YhiD involved in acid resistance